MNNSQLLNQWDDLCEDDQINNLPYEVETNEQGQLIMTPHGNLHSILQWRILKKLDSLMPFGEGAVELAVLTKRGMKTIDVAWMTSIDTLGVTTTAPAICIEVLSPSNSKKEMENKRALYFESGAQEVWICDKGAMTFYDIEGPMTSYDNSGAVSRSELCPSFPSRVPIPGVY